MGGGVVRDGKCSTLDKAVTSLVINVIYSKMNRLNIYQVMNILIHVHIRRGCQLHTDCSCGYVQVFDINTCVSQ